MRHPVVSALAALVLSASGVPAQAVITRTLKTTIGLHITLWTAPSGQEPPFGLAVHTKPGEPPSRLDKKQDVAVIKEPGTYALDFTPPDHGQRQFQLCLIEEYETTVARPSKTYYVNFTVTPNSVTATVDRESLAFPNCPAFLTIGTKAEPSPLLTFDKATASR